MSLQNSTFRALGALLVLLWAPVLAAAPQGIDAGQVRFAQVAALEGPAAALGQGMRLGLRAAFEEANRAGGIHGRQVVLDSFDDGYEPDLSVSHVRRLIAEDQHLGLIGAVGTPTSAATEPFATDAGWPFIGAFTGAGFLRNPTLTNVLNIRATYFAETEAWVKYLVDRRGLTSIAILYQDDGFGRVGLAGVTVALQKRGMSMVAEGTYTRNTVEVGLALQNIRKYKPQAVVMVGAYKPVAEFIRWSRRLDFDPVFVNISFVGSKALAEELGEDGAGVIVSQVVPFPWDMTLPVVAQYHAALEAIDPAAEPGFTSLEGYLVGRLALRALEEAGPELTRARFLTAMQALRRVSLGGVVMAFGPGDNQGMDSVFLTQITSEGRFEPVR